MSLSTYQWMDVNLAKEMMYNQEKLDVVQQECELE